ncbi:hypothetical protein [Geothermobacter hydrogeniphilus]|uniref:Uncharacterized protein n=1 Tax=Geothermobacter hydrogeniphilus TaxID=1969733 RepID=A0A1X0XXH3_9BACT|nr:hypothetical protein [Geothermobacter hydrogeniphilus]ORJ57643.1 hypothetical protein B5V00_12775 [Geothermobacter hydrogeniphilus]
MNRKNYRKLCELAADGDRRAIINLESHTQGEVLSCHHNYFNVRVGDGWEVWDRRICEPTIMTRESRDREDAMIDFQI